MSVELDLGNAANWEQIHYSSRFVSFSNSYTYTPIPEIDASGGVLRESPILATYATSEGARPTWKTAGWLHQTLRIGISVGGALDADYSDSRRVLLDRVKLHFLNRSIKNYGLLFYTPRWIKQLSLTVWQYTGTYIDTLQENIDLARIDVLRVEAKVDTLFRDWNQ